MKPAIRFRLYLGSPHNRETAARIVSKRFEGFTTYRADGFWRGESEACTVFEIVTPNQTGLESWNVEETARDLAKEFAQESVMLTAEEIPVWQFVKP